MIHALVKKVSPFVISAILAAPAFAGGSISSDDFLNAVPDEGVKLSLLNNYVIAPSGEAMRLPDGSRVLPFTIQAQGKLSGERIQFQILDTTSGTIVAIGPASTEGNSVKPLPFETKNCQFVRYGSCDGKVAQRNQCSGDGIDAECCCK